MEITIIRHQEVSMKWEKTYTSDGFNKACHLYDTSPIIPEKVKMLPPDFDIYTSTLVRTQDTARALFGNVALRKTELLNEVPMAAFKDTPKKYPSWIWYLIARTQWLFNSKRQPETRRETRKRAIAAIDYLEQNTERACCVTHGFYMITFIKELKKRGYKVDKGGSLFFRNLEMIRARK